MRGIAVVPRTGGKRAASASMRPERHGRPKMRKGRDMRRPSRSTRASRGQTKRGAGSAFRIDIERSFSVATTPRRGTGTIAVRAYPTT